MNMDYDVGNIFCKKLSSFIFSFVALSLSFVGLMFIQMLSFSPAIKFGSSLIALLVIVLLCLTLGKAGSVVATTYNIFQLIIYSYSYSTTPNSTNLFLLGLSIVSIVLIAFFWVFTYRVSEKMRMLRTKIDEEQNRRIESETASITERTVQRTSLIVKHSSITDKESVTKTIRESKTPRIDSLTTLPDREMLMDHLDSLIGERITYTQDDLDNKSQLSNISVIYLCVELNDIFNRSIGHRSFDLFIQCMAHRLRECADPLDMVGRVTGTEFVVITQRVLSESELKGYIDSLCFAAEDSLSDETGHLISKVRAGYSIYPEDARFPGDLLENAEIAMHEAFFKKEDYHRYNEAFRYDITAGLDNMPLDELRALLDQAIKDKEIYMVYQPVFDKSKNITGLEAFVRWNSPALGMINNYEFLAAAEKTGRIYEIGEYSIRTSLEKLKEINEEFPDLTMTVNISAVQLRNMDKGTSFSDMAKESGCKLSNVILDIPEESLLSNFPLIQPILENLSDLGITMALDNFGRGYSSLNNIPLLPISMVKLDGNFTADLKNGSPSRALTDSIISLLNEIDVPVDATGVGNATQYNALVEFGCTYFQGKFLCDPLKSDEVLSFIRKVQS